MPCGPSAKRRTLAIGLGSGLWLMARRAKAQSPRHPLRRSGRRTRSSEGQNIQHSSSRCRAVNPDIRNCAKLSPGSRWVPWACSACQNWDIAWRRPVVHSTSCQIASDYMPSVFRELPVSYAVLSEGRRCGSVSVVHEPSPIGPPYRASSSPPAGPPARATVRLHLRPGQKARSSFSLSTVTASSACAIATMRGGRSGLKNRGAPRRGTRLGAATASLRPRPDRRVTDPLRRRRSPRPREGGWWDVEPRAKGVGIALRSRHRARPGGPDRLGRRARRGPSI
jgi:hypothetical protein